MNSLPSLIMTSSCISIICLGCATTVCSTISFFLCGIGTANVSFVWAFVEDNEKSKKQHKDKKEYNSNRKNAYVKQLVLLV